jgi:hypothetical protein
VKKLLTFFAVVALATPAFALPTVQIASQTANGDGSTTYQLEISTLPEVSFLEFTIEAHTGSLNQVDGGATYDTVSSSPWAPSVVFSSDATLASALNPTYMANAGLDTTIHDGDDWPGKVSVDLTPPAGPGQGAIAGTSLVHVALTSFTGGVGGPLPGGFIPLAQVTVSQGGTGWVMGNLQSASDQDGSFSIMLGGVPEPSTALLACFGIAGMVAGLRRRRR